MILQQTLSNCIYIPNTRSRLRHDGQCCCHCNLSLGLPSVRLHSRSQEILDAEPVETHVGKSVVNHAALQLLQGLQPRLLVAQPARTSRCGASSCAAQLPSPNASDVCLSTAEFMARGANCAGIRPLAEAAIVGGVLGPAASRVLRRLHGQGSRGMGCLPTPVLSFTRAT